MHSSQTFAAPQIHPLTGEFRDAAVEHRFRVFHSVQAQQDNRVSLLVAAAGVAMFGLSDYLFLGLSTAFHQLLVVRALVIAGCLVVAFWVSASPLFLFRPWRLNAGPTVISIGAILILAIRPETIPTQMISVVVILLAIYLFVPNLIVGMVASGAFLSVGFLVGCFLWSGVDAAGLTIFGLLLISANSVGYMSARRLARLQREQFALLLEEQAAKERLLAEIGVREALEQRLRTIAQTDELTGCSNRRHFMSTAQAALAVAKTTGRAFSLCMIDVDRFKQINDTFGHAAGDRILQAVAGACGEVLRGGEPLGRIGGEEFVAALPGATLADARRIAERVRARIADLRFADLSPDLRVTATIGLSEVGDAEAEIGPALSRADAAMYQGKRAGRNTVRGAPIAR